MEDIAVNMALRDQTVHGCHQDGGVEVALLRKHGIDRSVKTSPHRTQYPLETLTAYTLPKTVFGSALEHWTACHDPEMGYHAKNTLQRNWMIHASTKKYIYNGEIKEF